MDWLVSLKEEDSSDLDLEPRNSCSGTDEKEEDSSDNWSRS